MPRNFAAIKRNRAMPRAKIRLCLISVDISDPSSHEPYQSSTRFAFNGMALITMQAGGRPGRVILTAKADGLKAASLSFEVAAGTPVSTMPRVDYL
jgi:beta-galactosidase